MNHPLGHRFHQHPIPFIALAQRLFNPFTLGDVGDYEVKGKGAVRALGGCSLQMSPECCFVPAEHPQFALLRLAAIKEPVAEKIVGVLVLGEEEVGKELRGELCSRHTQHDGAGTIDRHQQVFRAQGKISDRCQVIVIEILVPRSFQFYLDAAQLLILHFQLDLMHLQLVEHPPAFFGRQGPDIF